MRSLTYKDLTGLNLIDTQISAPQKHLRGPGGQAFEIGLLKCDNFINTRRRNGLVKRGGSKAYAVTGDIWGIAGYLFETGSPKLPNYDIPIRHRRNVATSFIEKLDWTADTWGAITQGANTAFDVGGVMTAAQIANALVVAAGKPAVITDIAAGNVNPLGGSAPVAPTAAAGAAGVLTGTYQWVITYRDSTSGWQSSPSPVSVVVTLTTQQGALTALPTTSDRPGVDKKRIYRTITTGEQPFLFVAEIALATATYNDNIADAALGTAAPDFASHNAPPTTSYLVEKHEGRIWIASGTGLWFSEAYDGNLFQLEYFNPDHVLYFPNRITGLKETSTGNLLVFTPPGMGIYEVQGRTATEFIARPLFPREGTQYPPSVSSHADMFTYWGEAGPRLVKGGEIVEQIDGDIREYLRDALLGQYDTSSFIWSVWHEATQQFLWGVSLTDSVGSSWVEAASQIAVRWVDSITGQTVGWHAV